MFRKSCNFPQQFELNLHHMSDSPTSASLHHKTIEHSGWVESQVTLDGPVSSDDLLQALGELPAGPESTVLGVDLFGTDKEIAGMEAVVKQAGITAPVTSVISSAPGCGGMQFAAATGIEPVPIILRDRISGYLIEGPGTRHCILGGLLPGNPEASREDQTRELFGTIEEALAFAGLSFEHVVRTWFYNDDILDWYPENAGQHGHRSAQSRRDSADGESRCRKIGAGRSPHSSHLFPAAMRRLRVWQRIQPRTRGFGFLLPPALHLGHGEHRARRSKRP